MADQGTGIIVTWDSSYIGTLNAGNLTANRASIDVTTFATSGGVKAFEPSDNTEYVLTGEILFDPSTDPNINEGAASSLTLTFSNSSGSTWAWSAAFMESLDVSMTLDERVRASVTIRLGGTLTITASP